jgi:predicted metalloendopeptidase
MGETRKRKKTKGLHCSIPIQAIASKSSYKDDKAVGNDFYDWVNGSWLKEKQIPDHLYDYSVSQEIEDCISDMTKKILKENINDNLKTVKESVMSAKSRENSLSCLEQSLASIAAIKTPEDIFDQLFIMCKRGISGVFSTGIYNGPDKVCCFYIDSGVCGLPKAFYDEPHIMYHYIAFMKRIEDVFHIEDLTRVFGTERHLVRMSDELSSYEKYKGRGSVLQRKFSKIPWARFFEILGLEGWKKLSIYYSSPRWFRFIGRAVRESPVKYWKWYISRCYITNALVFLPPAYTDLHFNFFSKILNGQKANLSDEDLAVKIVHSYMSDDYSKILWERVGSTELVESISDFTSTLIESAMRRIETADWLQYKTRLAAKKKIAAVDVQTVRPKLWAISLPIELRPDNLLENIYALCERRIDSEIAQIGHQNVFWDEGIYRVNAYYFNFKNQMIIPYGSCISPFYSISESPAWNYGSLGSVIGHELCHGFDQEGKDFNEKGEEKSWWARKDNREYNKRADGLVRLFNRQKIGKSHVDGEDTLSENIADLGGLGISLQALKDNQQKRGVVDPVSVKKEFQKFFVSYAVSWRTKTREKKTQRSLLTDAHSPAYLRVNLIVSQFDEWYAAFDIDSTADMFIRPADRIRIF